MGGGGGVSNTQCYSQKQKSLLIVNVTPNYKGIDAYFLCDTEIIGSKKCKFDTLTNKAPIDKQNYPLWLAKNSTSTCKTNAKC